LPHPDRSSKLFPTRDGGPRRMTDVFCTSCGSAIGRADNFCRTCGTQQCREPAVCYPMSLPKLTALGIGTFGLYLFLWFYRQWRAHARSGAPVRPFWRALFFPVTAHELFDTIDGAARGAGQPGRLPGRTLALALMGLVWAVPLLAPMPWTLLGVLGVVALLPAQAAVNRLNGAGSFHLRRNSAVSGWTGLPLVPGVMALGYLLASYSGLLPPEDVLSGGMLSARQDALVRSLAELEDGETIDVFFSAGLLSYSEDGNVVTDRRLISYFEDDAGLRALDWVEYDRISSVHVLFGGMFEFTSIIACAGPAGKLMLYSSGAPEGDLRMIAAIRDRLPKGTPVREEAAPGFACPVELET